MAPRGTKRASEPSALDPDAKRVSAYLKEQGITKPSFTALADIVEHPLAELSDDTRKMLKAMLPWSICVPVEGRDESQVSAINMLTEVHETVAQRLQEAIDAQSQTVSTLEESGSSFEQQLRDAEETLAEAKKDVDEHTKALAAVSESLFAARAAVNQAKAEQASGDADLQKIRAQEAEFNSALNESLKTLKDGDWKDEEGPAILKVLTAVADKLSLEDSLKTALSTSGLKRERGPFDLMVFDQLEETLTAKLSELNEQAEPLIGGSEERASKVVVAEAELETVTTSQRDAAAELSRLQTQQREASDAVAKIKSDAANFEPNLAKAKETLVQKEEELQCFRDYNVQIFNMMLERTMKTKEVEAPVDPEIAAVEGGA